MDGRPQAEAAARKRISMEDGGPWKKGSALQNSVMWGIMAFDDQAGMMTLEEDQLRVRWPAPADEPDPVRMNE